MRNEEYSWSLMQLSPSVLLTDQRYQRDLHQNQLKKAIEEFNVNLVNFPKVSKRDDGKYWIMDGDHTVQLWRMKFGDKPIMCKVYFGLTWQEEAEIFLAQTGVSSKPTSGEKLNTRLNMKDPEIVEMINAVNLCGISVSFKKDNAARGKCNAPDALYKAYKAHGRETLMNALTTILQTWDGEKESLYTGFIQGMSLFFRKYDGMFKKKDLVNSLKRQTPDWYIRQSRTIAGRIDVRYARVFLAAYNSYRSANRLPDKL